RAGQGSYAALYDADGIRIAHTESEEVVFHPAGALAPELVARLVAEQRFGPDTQRLLDDVRPFDEQFVRAQAQTPELGLFRGRGSVNRQTSIGVARRLATVPWTVFHMLSEQVLDAQIATMTRDKAILALVIMVAAFALGLALAGRILRPVVSLSA